MGLSSYLKVGRAWQKLWQHQPISPEYQQWRHRFILKRLRLMTWIAIVVSIMEIIVETTILIPLMNPSYPEYDFIHQNYELILCFEIIRSLQFLVAWLLLKISFFRQYPLLIFLWLISALFITKQIFYTIFLNQIVLSDNSWMQIFPMMAILMPVRWRWYFLAQGVVLGHFAISYLGFGLREPSVKYGIYYFDGVYDTIIVFLIVNLGVFLYERLLQQEFELKRQLRLFIYTVSHDLRSPVLGTMFLLKSLINPDAKKTLVENKILEQVVDSSDRQLQLIDSLLEAHTTETKGITIRSRPVCMEHLVKSVIQDMQPFLDRQEVNITKNVASWLPLVDIDPLQIRRVYENLIANALEYNQSELHITLEVELIKESPDTGHRQWLYCSVKDNGIGIPPQQLANIFNLYTRAASTKQSLNVGLGLYICRQIITAHRGEIGANSSSKGASFWFTLPISKTKTILSVGDRCNTS